jgi:SAM-dependent methyltransferase
MPEPTNKDMHNGISAQDTGWGTGTCAAPMESLMALLQSLGTTHLVQPIRGLFADTLPEIKDTIGPIAFLHMDGDWYDSTRDILVNLYDQLVPGAYVQVDDYGHWEGCRKALHDFFSERDIDIQLHPIDGTGIWFSKPDSMGTLAVSTTSMHLHGDFHRVTAGVATKQKTDVALLVNLGCGSRWHPDWINIDFQGDNSNVFQHNLREGLPLPDKSADFIYAGHCLEHFAPHDAERFLRECFRVLKTSGCLRIAVPNLEQIARVYLATLDAARTAVDDKEAVAKHEWMVIELVDQLCRHVSGGEMLRFWAQPDVPAEDFIISRIGMEYQNSRRHFKGMKQSFPSNDPLHVGAFRLGGEPHQWMYDEMSLARLLRHCGFINTQRRDASSSRLNGFVQYCLDTNKDGTIYKPDSLYMEAWLS